MKMLLGLATLVVFLAETQAQSEVCSAVLDLVFLVDRSGSICNDERVPTCDNWVLTTGFMAQVVDQLEVSELGAHVSLVIFGSSGEVSWKLNEYYDQAALRDALANLAYEPWQTTNTYEGLHLVHTEVLTGNVEDGDRPEVNNVVIIITDGKPTRNVNLTIPEAETLQRSAFSLVIGITGNVDEDTLKGLSSQPRLENKQYWQSPSFEELKTLIPSLVSETCVAVQPTPAPGCPNAADVCFIIDASGSIGEANFQQMRDAFNDIVNTLDVDAGNTRVCLIVFSDTAEIVFNLTAYDNREDMVTVGSSLYYQRGTTNTASALDMAIDTAFTEEFGDRPDVINIVVVLTDGGSNDKARTIQSAIRAKQEAVLLAVGIGGWTDTYELRAIASDPYSVNFWSVDSYAKLRDAEFISEMTDFLCNSINECSSNPCSNGQCIDLPGQYFCDCDTSYGGSTCRHFCRQTCNYVLAIDSSGSIGKEKFVKMLDFAKKVTGYMPVGKGSKVGMETFGSNTVKIMDFSSDMRSAMNSMSIPYYSGGTTDTASAVRDIRTVFFNPDTMETEDMDKCKVAIIITDGRSNDAIQTWTEAIETRDAGVQLLVVGVGGNVRMDELRGMASYPPSENIFTVTDFDDFDSIADDVRNAICNNVDNCDPNPCENNGQCTDLINGYYCTCPDDYTGNNCERGCSGSLDVLFLIDKSGSIRRERFDMVKVMLADVVKDLEVWEDKVRVAAISFSDEAQVEFLMDEYSHKQDIMERLLRIEYVGGRTNIADALGLARDEVFHVRNGARADVPNVVVMFSDGGANIKADETLLQASRIRIDGAHIIVAGVGQDLNLLELRAIASRPSDQHMYYVESFNELPELLSSIVPGTCNDVDECATNPCQNGGQCVDGFDIYTCACTNDYTGEHCERDSCRRQYDVVVILDISGSQYEVFEISMNFVQSLVNCLEFRFDRDRLAFITFADEARINFYMDEYQSSQDILEAMSIARTGGRTNTASAFTLARAEALSGRGARDFVQDKVILLTDGGSNVRPTETRTQAQTLKDQGAEIHVVAVGDNVDMSEITDVASGVAEPYIYRVNTPEEAEAAVGRLCDSLCV